jgi:uncharacterized protein
MAVVIFKAIEKCNSNCAYCNVIKKRQDTTMSLELLAIVFGRLDEYLTRFPDQSIDFTWHGGEVCLLGVDYFKQAIALQEKLLPKTKSRVNHQVQSNLTLITQELLDVFKQMGIRQIGSSFEPIPHIRGFGPDRDSDAYNRRFFNGANLLQKNGFTWGVIYVVHKQSLEIPLDIFHYLTNLNLYNGPNFNPVVLRPEESPEFGITPKQFADFLGAICPVWWKNHERFPSLKPFSSFLSSFRDHNLRPVCGNCGNCANNWVYIGPDGVTSQCGTAGDFNIIQYGSIQDRSLYDILYDPRREIFKNRQKNLFQTECNGCRYWKICLGGCAIDAAVMCGDISKRSPYCETLKIFIEQYFEPITGLNADFGTLEDTPDY